MTKQINNASNRVAFQSIVQSIKKYLPLILALLFLLSAASAVLSIAAFMPDTDTNFIIATGKYIVENREVPKINPFVIHEDFKTIIQQWGFDVVIYLIYNTFGYQGLFLFACVFMIIASVLFYCFVGLFTKNTNIKLIAISAFIYIFKAWAQTRPTIISFSLILSTVIIMELYKRDKHRWMIGLLPIISLILINTHASMWPMMFVMMLPYLCPNVFTLFDDFKGTMNVWWKKWWKVLPVVLIMVALGFVNPNGIRGMGYVIISYGVANGVAITELMSPQMNTESGIRVVLAIIAITLYLIKCKKHADSATVYMALGTIVLAAMHRRNSWFLLIGTIPVAVMLLNDLKIFNKDIAKKAKTVLMPVLAIIVCVTICITMFSYTFYVTDQSSMPLNAANYLDQFNNKEDVVLYTGFNNGAYMEFRGYKVYMDARPELYSEKINGKYNVLGEYTKFESDVNYAETVLEKYQFTHMIVENGSVLSGYMYHHPDYEQVIMGYGYVMYQRNGWIGDSILTH